MYNLLCLSMILLFLISYLNITDWQYILILISVMTFFSYFYDPYLAAVYSGESFSTDLTRHYYALDAFRKLGTEYKEFLISPIFYVFFFEYAQLFSVNDFFQVFCTFFSYTIALLSIYLYAKKIGVNKKDRFFMYFTLIGTMSYFSIVDNIRFPMAFACFILITYYDFMENKKSMLLYAIPILMHPGLVFGVSIRFLSKMKKKYIFLVMLVAGIFLAFFLTDFIYYLISYTETDSNLEIAMTQFQNKNALYFSAENMMFTSGRVLIIFGFLYVIFFYKIIDKYIKFHEFYKMIIISFLFVLMMIVSGNLNFIDRIGYIIPYALALLIGFYRKNYGKANGKIIIYITKLYILLLTAIMFLNQYKNNLAICIVD